MNYSEKIRNIINAGVSEQPGKDIWTAREFDFTTVSTASRILARLYKEGFIERPARGIYFKSRPLSVKGWMSLPNSNLLLAIYMKTHSLHASKLSAGNALGMTRQVPARACFATTAKHKSLKLLNIQPEFIMTGRPSIRRQTGAREGAFLELIRDKGYYCDNPNYWKNETWRIVLNRLLYSFRQCDMAELQTAVMYERPRIKAVVGALMELCEVDPKLIDNIRSSLSNRSRYEFGFFGFLPNAKSWYASDANDYLSQD